MFLTTSDCRSYKIECILGFLFIFVNAGKGVRDAYLFSFLKQSRVKGSINSPRQNVDPSFCIFSFDER